MTRARPGRYQKALVVWLVGISAFVGTTWACHWLNWNAATTACVYLIVIVVLSLADSFLIAVLFSLIAAGCLDFFFTEPVFTFVVAKVEDLSALTAFLITSGPAPFLWTVCRLSFMTSSSSKLCYRRSLPPKAVEALV
jgi:K+-sensing histidine kinase KdpD